MMRSRFDEQLAQLHRELIEMGALCERVIALASRALTTGDKSLAQQVPPLDRDIDRKERDIENLCLRLLLHQQPVAGDLRRISAALKMITDMERIGDQADDIAEIVLYLEDVPAESHELLRKMAEAAIGMVSDSVDAYVRQDVALAEKVIADDDTVDAYFDKVKQALIRRIADDPLRLLPIFRFRRMLIAGDNREALNVSRGEQDFRNAQPDRREQLVQILHSRSPLSKSLMHSASFSTPVIGMPLYIEARQPPVSRCPLTFIIPRPSAMRTKSAVSSGVGSVKVTLVIERLSFSARGANSFDSSSTEYSSAAFSLLRRSISATPPCASTQLNMSPAIYIAKAGGVLYMEPFFAIRS